MVKLFELVLTFYFFYVNFIIDFIIQYIII